MNMRDLKPYIDWLMVGIFIFLVIFIMFGGLKETKQEDCNVLDKHNDTTYFDYTKKCTILKNFVGEDVKGRCEWEIKK